MSQSTLPYIVFDGRTDEHKHERLDCTVRAVSAACSLEYGIAYTLLKTFGRKDRHKISFVAFMACHARLGEYGHRLIYSAEGLTVNQFLKLYKSGRFIVRIRGHVFAVVDGCVYDRIPVGAKSHIRNVWRLDSLAR
jgi:hypothetical protein